MERLQKRPFCNAFTGNNIDIKYFNKNTSLVAGCGRKRSPNQENEHEINFSNGIADDSLGDLLDLNSEPAVEDLMRQIMSQAKMWEAIQEANREITLQKNVRNGQNRQTFPSIAFNAQKWVEWETEYGLNVKSEKRNQLKYKFI